MKIKSGLQILLIFAKYQRFSNCVVKEVYLQFGLGAEVKKKASRKRAVYSFKWVTLLMKNVLMSIFGALKNFGGKV
jgi:hypothetical protein